MFCALHVDVTFLVSSMFASMMRASVLPRPQSLLALFFLLLISLSLTFTAL